MQVKNNLNLHSYIYLNECADQRLIRNLNREPEYMNRFLINLWEYD